MTLADVFETGDVEPLGEGQELLVQVVSHILQQFLVDIIDEFLKGLPGKFSSQEKFSTPGFGVREIRGHFLDPGGFRGHQVTIEVELLRFAVFLDDETVMLWASLRSFSRTGGAPPGLDLGPPFGATVWKQFSAHDAEFKILSVVLVRKVVLAFGANGPHNEGCDARAIF